MIIPSITLIFNDIKMPRKWVPKLRGYIASKYIEHPEVHHHDPQSDKYIYTYPLVQYKVIRRVPVILGIGHAQEIIKKIFQDTGHIKIGGNELSVYHRTVIIETVEWGIAPEMITYRFLSPWLGLNQRNYLKYMQADQWGKKDLLEKIIVGNLLSTSKSLGYTVPERIEVWTDLHQVPTELKGNRMMGFLGHIRVNFYIPPLWGIGKSVSRGFGTLISKDDEKILRHTL